MKWLPGLASFFAAKLLTTKVNRGGRVWVVPPSCTPETCDFLEV
jgi:hypothetical protein